MISYIFHPFFSTTTSLGPRERVVPSSPLLFSVVPEIEHFSEWEVRASAMKCQLLFPVDKNSASVT